MSDAISESLQAVATEGNVAAGSEVTSNLIDLAITQVNDFITLATENWWWVVAVLVLMKIEDLLIEHFNLPIPGGKVRWILLFSGTMFFSWAWVGFVGGFLPDA